MPGVGQAIRELQEQVVRLTGRVQALEDELRKPAPKPKQERPKK